MSSIKKMKQSNYELMRIVSMCFIIFWHIIVHNIPVSVIPSGTVRIALTTVLFFVVVHVNSFVMVTGYFSLNKKSTWKKALSLLGVVWFYKVVIILGLVLTSSIEISNVSFFRELLPFDFGNYWFLNVYLVLLLLIPFLNIAISNMDEKKHKKILILMFLLFSIIPCITDQQTISNNGYTLLQFVFIYFIGAYLKKYPIEKNYHFKRWSKNKLQLFYIIGFFFCFCSNLFLYYFSFVLKDLDSSILSNIGTIISSFALNYNSPFVILQTIFYFLFFGTLNIKRKSINFIGSLTMGVYLFHDNAYFKKVLFAPFQLKKHMMTLSILPYSVLIVIIIFVCGIGVEFLRSVLTEFLKKRKIVKKIGRKINNYIENF